MRQDNQNPDRIPVSLLMEPEIRNQIHHHGQTEGHRAFSPYLVHVLELLINGYQTADHGEAPETFTGWLRRLIAEDKEIHR